MVKLLKSRLIPMILALSLCFSVLVVPVQAFNPAIITTVASYLGAAMDISEWLNKIDSWLRGSSSDFSDYLVSSYRLNSDEGRLEVSRSDIDAFLSDFNRTCINRASFALEGRTITCDAGRFYVIACFAPDIVTPSFEWCLAYEGQIICAPVDDSVDYTDPDLLATTGQWMVYDSRRTQTIVSLADLSSMQQVLEASGKNCRVLKINEGYVLMDQGQYAWSEELVYCSAAGLMYVAPTDNRASNTENNYYSDTTEITTDNVEIVAGGDTNPNIGINIDGSSITLPDGTVLDITQTIYDDSTHTYYVDARDESNTYYNYTIQYHVDYTSITYIGQTAEYNKYYEVYYELPDGRSSADLTAEELEQLAVNVDVVPYVRYSDDTSLRSLYHFDGDTADASYWNYCTDFTWNMGASITYMDAGTFGGALYLDEHNHKFSLTLPSALGSGDFTIQWRYYQSHTASPPENPSSWVMMDDTYLLASNGKYFYSDFGDTLLAEILTGQWLELALVRQGGTVYYYVNGLCVGSRALSISLGDTIIFSYSSLEQTYKYLDELRVVNKALVEDGANYTPTSVPYDTNLTLVLPDMDQDLTADEYWSFNATGNVLDHYNFTDGSDVNIWATEMDTAMDDVYNDKVSFGSGWCYGLSSGSGSVRSSLEDCGTFVRLVGGEGDDANGDPMLVQRLFVLNSSNVRNELSGLDLKEGNDITLSVLLADGTEYSVTHTLLGLSAFNTNKAYYGHYSNVWLDSVELPNGAKLGIYVTKLPLDVTSKVLAVFFAITVPEGETLDIVYAEVVNGSEANTGHEFVEAVTAVDRLNSATLAVRTDLTITGYQIGGVRPSVPSKGFVWALVEGGIIKSLQIYTGSAWESVDGRIWTGERWIPYSAYDVLLLKDMYDVAGIVTPDDYEYIYTESGFWDWWQRQWLEFKTGLFTRLDNFNASGGTDSSDCQHAWAIDSRSDPTCTEPGKTMYSCPLCGGSYIEYTDALGHDWLEQEVVADSYSLPEGTCCPECYGIVITYVLDDKLYTCTCSDCDTVWTVEAEIGYGHTVYECSRCGATRVEYNDTESDLFAAIGNFLADGVYWISDKLTQLVDSLSGISDIFTGMAETMRQYVGSYPVFFGDFLALMPEDLMRVIWFGIVLMVAVAVYKKWFN